MSDGEIHARHYATRQPICLRWREGRITHLEPSSSEHAADRWVAPALFDLQVNGFGGIDFQQNNLEVDDLLLAAKRLRQAGCARILLTLITDEWLKLTARLRHLRELRSQSPELEAAIAGWHIEGPFLSSEPGFHGAHNPRWMLDPSPEHIRELRHITLNDPLLLTLAPERRGALEAISLAASLGIKLSLGHTNAPAETLRDAVRAGATGFTHLGNACPQQLDRHDNILWRVFENPGLTVGLIADRIHMSPALFRTVHRVLGPAAIYYTTDAMSAAGAPPGRYSIGPLELEVGEDQVVRQPGKSNFAGSALRPIDGVFRAAQMLDCPWQEVWDAFSGRPAQFMGLPLELRVGGKADFCLLTATEGNRLERFQVWVHGKTEA